MSDLIFSDDLPRIDWSDVGRLQIAYGVKGSTSLAIPRAWTLPFALVPASVVNGITKTSPFSSFCSDAQATRILSLVAPASSLIVRSSVIGESIWERGTYCSVQLDIAGADIIECLNAASLRVIESAQGRATGLMIQQYVRPISQGQFGNLQRISKTRDHWEISTHEPDGSTSRQRLNSPRDQAAEPDEPLFVRSGVARERLFGPIGAWLNNELLLGRSQRLNCEWITDNRKFFIVQVDEEDEDIGGVNPFQVRVPPAIRTSESNGHFLKMADAIALKTWDKLKVLTELWEPNAVHKPLLFFVPMAALSLRDSAEVLQALEDDFRALIGPAGIIVRTSVKADGDKIPNLPRTECLTPKSAAAWCLKTAAELSKSHARSDIAFVAHRFLASRASAWARAEPGNPVVEINSLWGLPDALQYCPYDIWEVHVPTGVATDYPDYKSNMMISRPDGGWEYKRVKNELARNNSIGSAEAKEIARRSIVIAERLGRACHIMWFVGCVDAHGAMFNIPWYWTEAHDAERNNDRASYRVFRIHDEASLEQFVAWEGARTRQALALSPTNLELMRDTTFIVKVGNVAKSAAVPIILSGSTLAHAYYQLRKLGCVIVTPSEKEHSRVRRTANLGKLVRDKIPAKIASRHELEITRKITGNLRMGFLISKLFEEALEVREAVDLPQKTEELADLFEVFRAIAKSEGISLGSIENIAEQKKHKSGGFEEGLVLLQTGISISDRSSVADLEKSIGDVLADQISDDVAEIPFSFFGFMELDKPRSIYFDRLNVRLDIMLRPDRIELKLTRSAEQLGLPFINQS